MKIIKIQKKKNFQCPETCIEKTKNTHEDMDDRVDDLVYKLHSKLTSLFLVLQCCFSIQSFLKI